MRSLAAGLFLVAIIPSSAVEAQERQNHPGYSLAGHMELRSVLIEPEPGKNQVDSIRVTTRDLPGWLQFRIVERSATSEDWQIFIWVGEDDTQVFQLSAVDIHDGRIDPRYVHVPVSRSGTLHVRFSEGSPSLFYRAIIIEVDSTESLKIQDGLNLVSLEGLAVDNPRFPIAQSLAKLRFNVPGYSGAWGRCTAFRIGGNLFLTNLHCVEDKNGGAHESFKLLFGELTSTHPDGDANANATVIAKGGEFVDDELLTLEGDGPGLDYALLRASTPEPFDGAKIRLADASQEAFLNEDGGALLDVYQHWEHPSRFDDCRPIGRCLSADAKCAVKFAISGCEVPNFRHRCDTEDGSSGSPVFPRAKRFAVGLHFGGTLAWNCALRISAVLEHLRTRHPAVWPEVEAALNE